MNLIVNILEEEYKLLQNSSFHTVIEECVRNGIPIPDNATNEDMIKAMFPNAKIEYQGGGIVRFIVDCWSFQIAEDWLFAPYQKGGKE